MLFAILLALTDLQRAQQLAWQQQFAESEALYRRILAAEPSSREARLGLARVVLWQKRYDEAIAMFRELDGIDALEGRATAEYWSGDLRAAARHFREVLARDPNREFARRSLAEIRSTAVPSQRITVDGVHDDQPLDGVRTEAAATFFSDPLTRWSVAAGGYRIEDTGGELIAIENETRTRALTFGARLGMFTFPDGVRRPLGGASVRWQSLTLRVDHREEIASATALNTHASSTTTALRWDHDRDWIGAVELSHRSYFDDNSGRAFVAYAVFPLRRDEWTLWSGGSVAARDTGESRFRLVGDRGRYDPYWTPDELREGRVVLALERSFAKGTVKIHADGGYARDRGRAFGEDGSGPYPFDRDYRPWRAGLSGAIALAPSLRLEAGIERSATVDYRSTIVHAALVRRR
ncbi:MAG TPA: tetratricopeptide repeat protein [Thermoanaerobaculia bacterium]|nr:tetratricopeptide repeat protein [Thermoanaerobaculia bacterium]